MFEKLLFLLGCAAILGWIKPGRSLILLAASAMTVFWLQPATAPSNLTFWLPVATLALTTLTWFITSAPEARGWKQNAPATLTLVTVALLADLDHFFDPLSLFTVFAPRPQILAIAFAALALIFFVIWITRTMNYIWLALSALTLICSLC